MIKPACGRSLMVTGIVATGLLMQPKLLVTDRVTLYTPAAANTCVGFCKVDVLSGPDPGSAKSHAQVLIVPLFGTEASVKEMVRVSHDGDVKLKLAVGNAYTVMVPLKDGFTHGPTVVTVYGNTPLTVGVPLMVNTPPA